MLNSALSRDACLCVGSDLSLCLSSFNQEIVLRWEEVGAESGGTKGHSHFLLYAAVAAWLSTVKVSFCWTRIDLSFIFCCLKCENNCTEHNWPRSVPCPLVTSRPSTHGWFQSDVWRRVDLQSLDRFFKWWAYGWLSLYCALQKKLAKGKINQSMN